MKYCLFLLLFFFINFEKGNDKNFICKNANTIYFFKNVKQDYMYIDYYQYEVSRIGVFNCTLKNNCKLHKVIKNKKFLSNSKFFNNCESKKI